MVDLLFCDSLHPWMLANVCWSLHSRAEFGCLLHSSLLWLQVGIRFYFYWFSLISKCLAHWRRFGFPGRSILHTTVTQFLTCGILVCTGNPGGLVFGRLRRLIWWRESWWGNFFLKVSCYNVSVCLIIVARKNIARVFHARLCSATYWIYLHLFIITVQWLIVL